MAAPDVFEWGYRRGNDPQHFREEYLSQKAHNFKAKLRWGDAYEVKIKYLDAFLQIRHLANYHLPYFVHLVIERPL